MKIQHLNNEVTINSNHFVAQGGEGSIYIRDGYAFKIGAPIPDAKIRELKPLDCSSIIVPLAPIFEKNKLVGFSMRAIKSRCSWGEASSISYKIDNAITLTTELEWFRQLIEILKKAHANKCLIVDVNELNFLISDSGEVVGIDTNSWQTPSFPATAIMPYIQDFTSPKPSNLTDFYSAGILGFQMLTGIHPYKGSHPDFSGSLLDRIKERCIKHTSVFNNKAAYPSSVLPFDRIPQNLRAWFYRVFEDGKRELPPDNFDEVRIAPTIKREVKGIKLIPTEFIDDCMFLLARRQLIHKGSLTPYFFDFLFANKYAGVNGKIYELYTLNNKVLSKHVCNYLDMPHATKLFSGALYQNMVGKHYFIIDGAQHHVQHIKGRLIDAKYENGILLTVHQEGAQYVLTACTKDGKTLWSESDIQNFGVNMAVLSNGVAVVKMYDVLRIFSANTTSIKDVQVNMSPQSKLIARGIELIIYDGTSYFKASLK